MRNWWWIGITNIIIGLFITAVIVHAQSSGEVRPIQANDVNNLQPLTLLDEHSGSIAEMSFSPAGNAFLSTSFDGALCIWNVAQLGQRPGQLRFCLSDYQAGISQFAWSPDGQYLALSSITSIDIYRITGVVSAEEIDEFTPEMSLPTTNVPLLNLQFLNEERLLGVDVTGELHLYHLPLASRLISLASLDFVALPEENVVLALNPAGQIIGVDTKLGIVDSTVEAEADHFLISPNQTWLLTWGDEVELWAVEDFSSKTAKSVYTLDIQLDGANFSPNGRFLVTWFDETLTFWDTETGEITATLSDHRSGVSIVRWIETEERVLTVSKRGTGRYWRVSPTGVVSTDVVDNSEGEIEASLAKIATSQV